jgi:ferritin-like metal-binding protein YciE
MTASYRILPDLLLHELADLLDIEQNLLVALPAMQEAAQDPMLKEAIGTHVEETRKQLSRVERCFRQLGQEPKPHVCHAIRGLIKEAEEACEATGDDVLDDLGIIAAAQRVEHYEMAAYTSARGAAETCKMTEIASLLQQTLTEEAATDTKLALIAADLYDEAPVSV